MEADPGAGVVGEVVRKRDPCIIINHSSSIALDAGASG